MRVAILHDYLNQFGGAERVLQVLLEMFPQADLYTLAYDKERSRGLFDGKVKGTSFIDWPIVRRYHRLFIPFMPLAAASFRQKGNYDLVVSSTAGYAKGFNIKAPYHVSYCHSPLRYAWEMEYMKDIPFAPSGFKTAVARPIAKILKRWDKRASDRVNFFIANSSFIADKVRAYYGREASVVYPPIRDDVFYPEPAEGKRDYYLMAGRLLYYKRFDLGIEAMNRLKRPLKVVGQGPELKKLRKMVRNGNIEFIEGADDGALRHLYSGAKALLFPQVEDFGLVAAEAQACGTPVIAFNAGGAREIVAHKKNGYLFDKQTPESVIEAVQAFENLSFDRRAIAASAQRFSKDNFKRNLAGIFAEFGLKI
ncbi:glycosyltransferase [Patescibacteria group bacterium]|nr:glycosyltransferase [Patescibacteria group bacterium]